MSELEPEAGEIHVGFHFQAVRELPVYHEILIFHDLVLWTFLQRPGLEGQCLVLGRAFIQAEIADLNCVLCLRLQTLRWCEQHTARVAGHLFTGERQIAAAFVATQRDALVDVAQGDCAGETQCDGRLGGHLALAVVGIGVEQALIVALARVAAEIVDR